MKAKLHLPTEQYGFVEIEADVDSPEEAIDIYNATRSPKMPLGAINGQETPFDTKEARAVLDGYLTEGTMLSTDYEGLTQAEQVVIQTLKRAFKRLNKI